MTMVPRWTDADVARLVVLYRAGASGKAIARTLKRSELACNSKIDRLRDEGVDLPMRNAAGAVPGTGRRA
jgi:biotin operon repressor